MHATRLVVLLTAIFAVLGVITPASAVTSPSCGITWGSQPKWEADQGETEVLIGVRAGRHACFDRLVLDLGWSDNEFSAYDVRYVDVVQHEGSGRPVPVRGGAVLQVSVGAPAYDEDGRPTVPLGPEMVDVAGSTRFGRSRRPAASRAGRP